VLPQRDRPLLTGRDVDRAIGLHRIARGILRALAEESGPGIDRALDAALAEVGAYCGVDRAYVFRFRDEMRFVDNTHEWCAPGVSPEIENLQGVPGEVARTWIEAFEREEFVFVSAVAAIPDGERDLREILESQGILSLLVAPLRAAGELIGLIGFDYVRAPSELSWIDVDVLVTLADTVAAALFRRDTEAATRYPGTVDPLTGLSGEAHCRELLADLISDLRAGRARSHSAPTSGERALVVAVTDIDRLAEVNIAHGLLAGDAVVREIARRLVAGAQPGDHVARFGSDEFAVIVDGERGVDTAEAVAERVRAAFREPIEFGSHRIRVRGSVGVFAPTGAPGEVSDVLAAALAARAEAKVRGGDGVVCFDADLGRRADRRRALAEALRRPDVTEHVSVAYQPVVELATGRVLGAEALLRWSAPSTGAVPTDEVVALAESTGEIEALSEYVIRTALTDLVTRFRHLSADFGLSFNVSPVHLGHPNAVATIDRLITESGVDRRRLWIEMTETAVSDGDAILGPLAELRARGLDVALDDFGTGHSSFARLRSLPVTGIKIDRAFVADIAWDTVAQSLVEAQIAIAVALGLRVLAEGVENEEERETLLRLGIEMGQGFGLHRPMTGDDLVALLARSD